MGSDKTPFVKGLAESRRAPREIMKKIIKVLRPQDNPLDGQRRRYTQTRATGFYKVKNPSQCGCAKAAQQLEAADRRRETTFFWYRINSNTRSHNRQWDGQN